MRSVRDAECIDGRWKCEGKNWKVIRFPLIYCYVCAAIRILQYLGIFSRLTMPICRHNLNFHFACNSKRLRVQFRARLSCIAMAASVNLDRFAKILKPPSTPLPSIDFIPSVAHWPQPNAISFDWKWIFDDVVIANGDLSSLTPLRQISCGMSTEKIGLMVNIERNDFASRFKITSGCFELRHVTFVSSFDWT